MDDTREREKNKKKGIKSGWTKRMRDGEKTLRNE